MDFLDFDDINEYVEMFCIDKEKFLTSVKNLETILLAVESVFRELPVDNRVKIHFPDNLTLKYSVRDWDDELNFRVLMKDVFHVINEKNDLSVETVSAQNVQHFRFFNNNFEIKYDSPEYFDDPVGTILGVN